MTFYANDHDNNPPTPEPWEAQPVQPVQPEQPVSEGHPLDLARDWLGRFVSTMSDDDLDLLTLWPAHTHLCIETYTSPRLIIDSPVHGSGKTTCLEHIGRLALRPVQMASLSSPALLTRMLDAGMRTILIDEADRSLDPKKDGVEELLAVLNSGYKRGGTRPVLTPTKDGWGVSEMPTYAPVAMAGNNPNLPEDTKSRTIRVLLLPDLEGRVEESDWELIEDDARAIGQRLAAWADSVRDEVRMNRPPLPECIKGRSRERWGPLKRVAVAAGGRWPAVVDALAIKDHERLEMDREDGMVRERPAVLLLKHLAEMWPVGETFIPTSTIVADLAVGHPGEWGDASPFGKALTPQRFGRMLATSYGINSGRPGGVGPRGYTFASLQTAFHRMGITPPSGTGWTGGTGGTGGKCPCGELLSEARVAFGKHECVGCEVAA